jgi:hypothetical protein
MGEREKQEGKKETTTGEIPSIDHHHTPHHEEKGKAMLLMTRQNNIFSHKDTLQALS